MFFNVFAGLAKRSGFPPLHEGYGILNAVAQKKNILEGCILLNQFHIYTWDFVHNQSIIFSLETRRFNPGESI